MTKTQQFAVIEKRAEIKQADLFSISEKDLIEKRGSGYLILLIILSIVIIVSIILYIKKKREYQLASDSPQKHIIT